MRLLIVLSIALLLPASASAHGVWYGTAAATERRIEAKYPMVTTASCGKVPRWAWAKYGVDSFVRGDVRRWNHFYCGVYSTYLGRPCLVVAHWLGERNVVATSWPRGGCTTRALWG
jgi:hypothetical protein